MSPSFMNAGPAFTFVFTFIARLLGGCRVESRRSLHSNERAAAHSAGDSPADDRIGLQFRRPGAAGPARPRAAPERHRRGGRCDLGNGVADAATVGHIALEAAQTGLGWKKTRQLSQMARPQGREQ